jgi:hypothetical protein
MAAIYNGEILCNAVLALISPGLYDLGRSSIQNIMQGSHMARTGPSVSGWPSVFHAMQIIVNRSTPPHRDGQTFTSAFDILLSVGTQEDARLSLPDVGASLSYLPGSMVALSGNVLIHGIDSWSGGDRACIARFMRDNIFNRLGLNRSSWSHVDDFT